ncbi:universal stress protein UspA [Elizabethkingia ursingii]|uniref:Universal stress protein n=2 Tax=Elizabethkingia ursingii TaxID=1756150 RepID=A0AAJ3NAR1_9FLAO|nr:universal stress protein UspA [Elizabethkingia ursingii]OPB73683.1 universal stress protein UspA [Elizabethkingia ursingii]OPB88711.1 universal stress protein UspA [Elizabethkingia ursingii]
MKMKSIIIALDESTYSQVIARQGFELATVFKSTVTILLIRNNEAVINASLANISIEENDNSEEKLMIEIQELAKIFDTIEYSMTTLEGDPMEEIIRFVTDNTADLLIVGTHGRTGLDHWITGSVAEHVIRHATIPVLVIPYNHQAH